MRDPADGAYQSQIALTEGTIAPIAFPNLSISVHRLLD